MPCLARFAFAFGGSQAQRIPISVVATNMALQPSRVKTPRTLSSQPRNMRGHCIYGYSPVQQVLMTVNIGLRRQLDYFSDGSIPDALIGVSQGCTPDQIRQIRIIGAPNSPANSPNAAAPSLCPATPRHGWCRPSSPSARTISTNGWCGFDPFGNSAADRSMALNATAK